MAKGLTKKQESILDFVAKYIQREGFPPSIREIGQEFNIASLRGVTVHLDALVKKGCIERSNTPRSIRVIHPAYQTSTRAVMLPLYGQVAAGSPILAEQTVEDMIPVPQDMVKNVPGAFLLQVKGESMTGDGIIPRDLVVIRPQQVANPSDLVAVVVEDEAAIKRVEFDGARAILKSSNPLYPPYEADASRTRIIGRVIGLIRDYDGMAF